MIVHHLQYDLSKEDILSRDLHVIKWMRMPIKQIIRQRYRISLMRSGYGLERTFRTFCCLLASVFWWQYVFRFIVYMKYLKALTFIRRIYCFNLSNFPSTKSQTIHIFRMYCSFISQLLQLLSISEVNLILFLFNIVFV